jgi:hypothetical protein
MVRAEARAEGRGRRRPSGPLATALPLVLLLAGLGVAGCSQDRVRPIRPEDDLHDPDPRRRTDAIVTAARSRDTKHVPQMIELLADPDPAVRLVVGASLRDLTGHDTGYVAYAPPEVLRQQVLAWRAWWASRSSAPVPPAPSSPPRPPPPPTADLSRGAP